MNVLSVKDSKGKSAFWRFVGQITPDGPKRYMELDSSLAAHQFKIEGDTLFAGGSVYGSFFALKPNLRKR